MKYFVGFALLLLGIFLTIAAVFSKSTHSETTTPVDTFFNEIPTSIPTSKQKIFFSAEVLYSNEKQSIASIASASASLNEIFPLWYSLTSTGMVKQYPSVDKKEILQLAKEMGIKTIPTIYIEWGLSKDNILSSQEKKLQTAGKIIDLVVQNSYDGININLENIPSEFLPEFSPVIESIHQEFKRQDKAITITLNYQKNIENVTANSQTFNLGKNINQMRVSVVNYASPSSTPQPVLSNESFTRMVKDIVTFISKEKVSIVLPLHGYEWSGVNVTPITHIEALSKIKNTKNEFERDLISKELQGTYERAGKINTIWFQDFESIKEKMKLAKEYDINNFSFKYIGGEDPLLWSKIAGT